MFTPMDIPMRGEGELKCKDKKPFCQLKTFSHVIAVLVIRYVETEAVHRQATGSTIDRREGVDKKSNVITQASNI